MVNRSVMPVGAVRPLTEGERAALSLGLDNALAESGVEPLIVARPSIPALIAAFWRGRSPVMVLGRRIFWPGALEDFSQGPPRAMSVLQHELQHVLEFRTGALTLFTYVLWPGNWRYGYRLTYTTAWTSLGAEQRAQAVQDYWLAQHGLLQSEASLDAYRNLIPWAR